MTNPMTDPQTVADGLTEAMRRAILWLPADGSFQDHRRAPKSNAGISSTSLKMLKERIDGEPEREVARIYRLVQSSSNTGAKERGQLRRNTQYRLTPFGLAVQAILKGRI